MHGRHGRRCCSSCRSRCPTHLCGTDVDDLFAYTTTKSIKIRDARLGLLHYSLMFLIVLYILVYQLIAKNGYLRFSPAQNSVRLTLQEPTNNCNPNKPDCQDSFVPVSQLPYCCAKNSSCRATPGDSCSCSFRPSFSNYNCTWMGGDAASIVQESSIMVTTLVHQYNQTLNASCFEGFPTASGSCSKVWIVDSDAIFFIANIEAFTVLVDHSVSSPTNGLAISSRQMSGMLYVAGGSDMQRQLCASRSDAVDSAVGGSATDGAPCYLPPDKADGLDVFSVGVLLQAMGVSLEDRSYSGSGHSVRYEGLTASLVIEYSNTRPWKGLDDTRYIYKPSIIPQSTYKTTQLESFGRNRRRKSDLHGVLLDVQPGGSLAVFDLTQALVQLTTSLTLLAMATIGVNILAQYVLRLRHYYSEALYERTADFGGLSALEDQPDDAIDEELRRRHLPTSGSKYRRILRLLEDGFQPAEAASFAASSPGSLSVEAGGVRPRAPESVSRPMLEQRG